MKEKHRKVLAKFQSYGENFDPAVDYNQKQLKFVNYSRNRTTRNNFRETKSDIHDGHVATCHGANDSTVVLIGASIVAGLKKCRSVWHRYFARLSTINLGIGGDRTEHILWRNEDIDLPSTVEYLPSHSLWNKQFERLFKDC